MVYAHNDLARCARHSTAPVRFTAVVTADPDAAQLTEEDRQVVTDLLNNDDDQHKILFGATLQQILQFMAALEAEHSSWQGEGE